MSAYSSLGLCRFASPKSYIDEALLGPFNSKEQNEILPLIKSAERVKQAWLSSCGKYITKFGYPIKCPFDVTSSFASQSWATCSLLHYSHCFFCGSIMPDYTPGQLLASCDHHEISPTFLFCFSEFEEAVQNELYLNALRKTLKQLKPDTYSSITIEEYEDYKKYCDKHTHLPKIVSPFEVITDGLFQSFQNPPGESFKTLFESLEIFMVLSFLIEKAKNPPRV